MAKTSTVKKADPAEDDLERVLGRSAAGEPLYIIAQMQDITQRKHAEEAMRDSEQRYRELVESQQDLLVRFDRGGRVTFANDSLCRTLGDPREAIHAERIRIGPRIKKLRGLLAKLDPASTERAVTPYPPPRPSAEPPLSEAKRRPAAALAQ